MTRPIAFRSIRASFMTKQELIERIYRMKGLPPDLTKKTVGFIVDAVFNEIGDYFVKQLCDGDPEQERRALSAHARHERMRAQLTGDQSDEIRAFFAEEDERGELALG